MSEQEAVVRGEGVIKTFKDFWGRDKVKALRGVDIVIPKGSVFGLLGPNGAGKSTLIKLILGHLYPTNGRLSVMGKDPRDVEIKFKIGYLPERSYLYKNLTAEETLYYFGEILNLSKEQIKNRSDQLLEMVGLQNAKKRYVGEFSHGMTRRMGMAQALLNDPDFIILDEPTAGLDPVGCREVKDLIITLGKRGKTVLLTSHLLADVEDTCDEIMMIYGGTVQSQGKIEDLLADTDRVKLEFPANMGVDVNALKNELDKKTNNSVKVSSPKQSLEQYFLNIVNKGSSSQETAGAQQGKGVADYLKSNLPKDVQIKESIQEKVVEPEIEAKSTTPEASSKPEEKKEEPVLVPEKVPSEPEEKKVEVVPVEKESLDVVKESDALEEKAIEVDEKPIVEEKLDTTGQATVDEDVSAPIVELKTEVSPLDELKASKDDEVEANEPLVDDEDDDDLDEGLLDKLTL
ncbi:MAG: ATP-binding cassette domain-containing protein [Lentisphaeraceae bacterium]|nr:ATP-binding cassette domain-containing protein [Lentisphaeraceae bacterium]